MSALGRLAALFVIAFGAVLASPAAVYAAEEEPVATGVGEHAKPDPLAWSYNLSIFSLIVFVLFLLVLSKLAWKPLSQGLDRREARIRDDIAAAEQARAKAERMLAEHAAKLDRVQDEVKAILSEARRDAEVARQNIVSDAQAEAKATRDRAISEIDRAKDQALKEMFDHFAQRVADATEHVLGSGLTPADQDRLINDALTRIADRPAAATRA
jgi:F-type H+-transporting ATPase subunit b